MIRAVIFDFGGVLVRTADPVGRREWEDRLALERGELEQIVHGSDDWIKTQRGLISHDAYWQRIGQQLGLSEAETITLQGDYFRNDYLDPSLIELIDEVRWAGIKVGLLSNDLAALADKLRDKLGIFGLFHAVIISANIGVIKPDAGAYAAICEALNVSPAECVFIDDMQANIDGAEAFGMQAIRYHAGMDLPAALIPLLNRV